MTEGFALVNACALLAFPVFYRIEDQPQGWFVLTWMIASGVLSAIYLIGAVT